ncbi:hypothetical protein N7462_007226 [Penicillium macrosclerotiorum]|uniref:uncharacterized protein n=1 Tax=Penicillium macrosclerotiorum TaxID=303699 RepID=UPI002547C53C|nr:uncharacterized protein N7462_007226 [Penicillium macrosclerotiorum]KAJ5678982.1 hypothetical protein N7462_007226 [Penicillium macrosclerotiorum]
MDLSSLEGPPIVDTRAGIQSRSTPIPHIQEEPPTPQGGTHFNLYSKPLPPRPASADPLFARPLHRHSIESHPSSSSCARQENDGSLRRTYTQSGQRDSPSERLLRVNTVHSAHPANLIDPARYARSRSPPLHIPTQPTASTLPRRTRSCCTLVWLEDEELWAVTNPTDSPTSPPARRHCPPVRVQAPLAQRPAELPSSRHQDDAQVSLYANHAIPMSPVSPLSPPPSYDSHRFSPTHVMRQRQRSTSGWGAVARRVHNLSNR